MTLNTEAPTYIFVINPTLIQKGTFCSSIILFIVSGLRLNFSKVTSPFVNSMSILSLTKP